MVRTGHGDSVRRAWLRPEATSASAWTVRFAPTRAGAWRWSAVTFPALTAHEVARALHALRGTDAVFGPATDGGYWLVAMGGRRPATPFARVRWSGEHALDDTLANFAGRRVRFAKTLADVDRAADLTPGARAAAA